MTTIPKFIKVHDLADPETVYTINAHTIEYYCNIHSADHMTCYTFLKLTSDVSVKISETVQELDAMLEVCDVEDEN